MKKLVTYSAVVLLAGIAVSFAQTPDKTAMEAKENAAWQAYKDRKADAFQKLVDKDVRCVYPDGIQKMSEELADMKKWDIKSFAISNYETFSDEKDVIVATYMVKVEGTYDGKDMTGSYNAGSVWKQEGNDWLAIFHTNIKQEK